jgi:hypothetical protein
MQIADSTRFRHIDAETPAPGNGVCRLFYVRPG